MSPVEPAPDPTPKPSVIAHLPPGTGAGDAAPGGSGFQEAPRYVLGEPLNHGGMGTVLHGLRVAPGGFEREVLLKRLRTELASDAQAAALLVREACLCARLEHPGIVQTLDLCEIDGARYLVMEYVRGGDLRVLLRRARRRGQRFSVAAALHIGRELLAALDYAHGLRRPDGRLLGIIHRDVSPANVLLSTEGEVKLTDFGIAQDTSGSVTIPETGGSTEAAAEAAEGQAPRARGKVGYMAPEQARGEPVDTRADLFSVAVVLYEVLTGKRLFVGQVEHSPVEVYGVPIEFPSKLRADVPAALDAVLLKALAPRKGQRFQTARAFHQVLLEVTRQHGLWLDRTELAAHLHEVCGPDPALWSSLDDRSATALIASLGGDELDVDEDAITGARNRDASDEVDVEAGWDALAREGTGMPATGPAPLVATHDADPAITVPFPTVPAPPSLPGPVAPPAADAVSTAVPAASPGPLLDETVQIEQLAQLDEILPQAPTADPVLDGDTAQVTRSLLLEAGDLLEVMPPRTTPVLAVDSSPLLLAPFASPGSLGIDQADPTMPLGALDPSTLPLLEPGRDIGEHATARQLRHAESRATIRDLVPLPPAGPISQPISQPTALAHPHSSQPSWPGPSSHPSLTPAPALHALGPLARAWAQVVAALRRMRALARQICQRIFVG